MATARPAQSNRQSRAGERRPAAYQPMPHPGTPGRWNPESIREALRAWIAETGAPPGRDDWSGQRPDQAGQAQRKWMIDHPRWPSSSCVRGHFGSWSAALEAAGLPSRQLTFTNSVAERVDTARRLAADGWGAHAIAQELGVSRSSVHNYLKAGTCPDCGGPVTNPLAERCAPCTTHEPTVTRSWNRAAVRDAIREWHSEHGRPPSCRDWTPARSNPGRWEADSPRWPSAAVVCDLYRDHPDPWNSALTDAGSELRFRRWNDDSLRAALAEFWVQTGRAPQPLDLAADDWNGPHHATVRRRYGSLAAAWRALGPAPLET
jgi:hypothetical protein